MSSNLHTAVSNCLNQNDISNCRVILACSGGLDSTVMTNLVCDVAPEFDVTVIVAHLHHGLRGIEADGDQRFVVGLAEQHHCKSINHQVDVEALAKESGKGIEAAAREARYSFFDAVAKDLGAQFIMVAHTADDVAESFIMNAARGSGIDGLTAHGRTRSLENAIVVRPLWSIQRSELRTYAEEQRIEWREDSSNADESFLRNRIRSTVIPALRETFGEEVTERISRTVEDLTPSRSIVHEVSSNLATDLTHEVSNTTVLNSAGINALESPLKTEVVRFILKRLLHQPPRRADIQRVIALVDSKAGSRATISGSYEAIKDNADIVIQLVKQNGQQDQLAIPIDGPGAYVSGSQRVEISTRSAPPKKLKATQSEMYADAGAIKGQLVWREWRDGDRFQPFGMQGTTLVSDVITDSDVPHSQRRSIRVLADDEGVLWVCGLRTAERLRITSATTTTMMAQIQSVDEAEDV